MSVNSDIYTYIYIYIYIYIYSNNINFNADMDPILILFRKNLDSSPHFRQLTKVHCTFVNTSPGISPIDESPLYFRQHIPWNFANWRKSIVLSLIHPLEFRQLAKVHCTFANASPGISPIGEIPPYFHHRRKSY